MEFWELVLRRLLVLREGPSIITEILFSDEASLPVNGEENPTSLE